MSELAELLEWALVIVDVVLAHLSLELLLHGVELTLIAVEVIVVALLGQMSHDLSWWVVEISLLTVGIKLSLLVLVLFAGRVGLSLQDSLNWSRWSLFWSLHDLGFG